MKLNPKAYSLIYRARKRGVRINIHNRTMVYAYGDSEEVSRVKSRLCGRLCKELGFAIQSEIA